MEETIFAFQKKAVKELRKCVANGLRTYRMDSEWNQVVSLQAPTGSGKTIILTALIESILYGAEAGEYDLEMSGYEPQPDAIFLWLSDSPSLNAQSRDKISFKSGKIRLSQCVEIQEDSFDQEVLSDGMIYFLNTQKLSSTSKLVQHGDRRTFTIWETLENTAREKSNRLYVIIDEAHRGTQGTEAGKATSIMQRFIKGFDTDIHHMRPMPLIVGMSATAERFNRLIDSCEHSALLRVLVKPEDVRSSGLLKERIKVVYTEDVGKYDTVAVLQAAVEEYVSKCEHWLNYTRVYHYENVCPIFVVQVEAGSGKKISDTNLDEMLATINDGLPVAAGKRSGAYVRLAGRYRHQRHDRASRRAGTHPRRQEHPCRPVQGKPFHGMGLSARGDDDVLSDGTGSDVHRAAPRTHDTDAARLAHRFGRDAQ